MYTRRRAALIVMLCIMGSGIGSAGDVPHPFWRSSLYPMDWTPAFEDTEGRFLHDFSYAGYHNSEIPIPQTPPGDVFNVVTAYGADNQGHTDATSAIQQTINAATAAGAGIVFLPAGLYRCDGQLSVTHSGIVIRGAGEFQTHLYFTKFAGMGGGSHITFSGAVARGPDLPLAVDGVNRSFAIYLDDASSLHAGDDISIGWVITDAFVEEHGMTGVWQAFNGTWRPVFRRKVVSVNTSVSPHEVRLDVPLRYPAKLRDSASARKETGYLEECGMEQLSIANAVAYLDAWTEIGVHAIHFQNAKDCWASHVNTFVSPADPSGEYHLQGGGIRITASKRFTVAECRLAKAQNRGGGGCGYLFHTTTTNEILFRDCIGDAGRHNFIVNWDFGSTGCVFLRCTSSNGREVDLENPFTVVGQCEYHHSLAMACLVDQCAINDGWQGGNRELWSSGAGHTVTENAYWNMTGTGLVQAYAYGWGYVVGTDRINVMTTIFPGPNPLTPCRGTEPEDYKEGISQGATLLPRSLFEDQLARRLGVPDTDGDGLKDTVESSGSTGYDTRPDNPDTDNDGLTDGDEILGALGPVTDPTNADTDDDGFSDYQEEVLYHTDPNSRTSTPMPSLSVPYFRQ